MNWYERHLNCTGLGIAVGSVLAFEVFTRLSLGFNNIFFENIIRFGFLQVIWLGVVIFSCFAISLIGYGWIIYQKKRSSWLLVFYLFIAVLYLTAFIYQAMFERHLYLDYPFFLSYLGLSIILVFAVAWITLISLKKIARNLC